MKPRPVVWWAAIAIVASPSIVYPDTLPTVADSQLSLAAVAAKGGALTTLTVKNALPGGAVRGLARFDLSALPSGASIEKATLRAWVNSVLKEGTIDVVAVLGPWAEATVNQATAPDLAASPSATLSVTKASLKTFVSADVTDLVQDWLSATLPNNGVALLGGADDVYAKFDSKENTLGGHGVELEVIVSSSGPQGPPGPQGLQGLQGIQGIQGTQGPPGPTALQVAPIIWSGGCPTHGTAAGWNTYCNSALDFSTAGDYLEANGDRFTVKKAGFYRISFWAISLGPGYAHIVLKRNGSTFYYGHESGGSSSTWTDNFADQTWSFNAGDVLTIEVYNPGTYAYHSWNASGAHSRVQIRYEGPLS